MWKLFFIRDTTCSSYDLMMQCWSKDPNKRPSFAEIDKIVGDILFKENATTTSDHMDNYVGEQPSEYVGDRPSSDVGEQPSLDSYLPMSGQTSDQPVGKSGTKVASSDGYLRMSGQKSDHLDGKSGTNLPSSDRHVPMSGETKDGKRIAPRPKTRKNRTRPINQ